MAKSLINIYHKKRTGFSINNWCCVLYNCITEGGKLSFPLREPLHCIERSRILRHILQRADMETAHELYSVWRTETIAGLESSMVKKGFGVVWFPQAFVAMR